MANLKNIGMAEFKDLIGATTIEIYKNPKTGKLFASASTGDKFKVELAIDFKKPVSWLMEDGDLDSACLINTRTTIETLATF